VNAHSVYQTGAVVTFSSALPAAYCVLCAVHCCNWTILMQNAFNVFIAPIFFF